MSTYSELLKDPRWQRKRLEIFQRDNWMCQSCTSTTETLHVHHLSYGSGFPWEVDNSQLITLCQLCHKLEESLKHLDSEIVKSACDGGLTRIQLIKVISFLRVLNQKSQNSREALKEVLLPLQDKYVSKEEENHVIDLLNGILGVTHGLSIS